MLKACCIALFAVALLAQQTTVPFVGCKSDGQVGPLGAPTGANKAVQISAGAAERLAYYKAARGPGVLAPRGWQCLGAYGSSGAFLMLAPTPIDMQHGSAGPGIQMSFSNGGTSGRFAVARVIARVFPAHRAFAEQVIAEGIEKASNFPFGPWPGDKLTYKSGDVVEYETPANSDGLGTNSRLNKNDSPIRGVAIVTGPETGLLQLSVRLPGNLADLTAVIIQQVERDAATPR